MSLEQIKKAKKGNKVAFEEIIMEQIDYLYRIAYGILKREEDIADAVSNTVLKAYEKIGTLKKEEFFKTWITKILMNECHNLIRKQKRIVYIEDYQQEKLIITQDNENQIDVKMAVQGLDTNLKEIVTLFYFQEKTIQNIAKELNVPEGTVKSRLSRARKKMAETLQYKEDSM